MPSLFDICPECGRKMAKSDPHRVCIICLPEAHVPEECDLCQSLSARTLRDRRRIRLQGLEERRLKAQGGSSPAETSGGLPRGRKPSKRPLSPPTSKTSSRTSRGMTAVCSPSPQGSGEKRRRRSTSRRDVESSPPQTTTASSQSTPSTSPSRLRRREHARHRRSPSWRRRRSPSAKRRCSPSRFHDVEVPSWAVDVRKADDVETKIAVEETVDVEEDFDVEKEVFIQEEGWECRRGFWDTRKRGGVTGLGVLGGLYAYTAEVTYSPSSFTKGPSSSGPCTASSSSSSSSVDPCTGGTTCRPTKIGFVASLSDATERDPTAEAPSDCAWEACGSAQTQEVAVPLD